VSLAARLHAVVSVLASAVRLGPRDGLTCLQAWLLLHWWGLRLRLAGRRGGASGCPDPWPGEKAAAGEVPAAVARLVALFDEAARHPAMGLWCQPRALALRQLLRAHGVEADLAVGLRREAAGLGGHAWVVHRGVPLGADGALAASYARGRVA
jgi:hypothetical protein